MASSRTRSGWDPVIAKIILIGVAVPLGTILGAMAASGPLPWDAFIIWSASSGGVVGAAAAWAGLLAGALSAGLLGRTAISSRAKFAMVSIFSGLGSAGIVWVCLWTVPLIYPPAVLVVSTFIISTVLAAIACAVLRRNLADPIVKHARR